MAITEDRVTIFTKNTGKYSGIALILDLTRSINHTYGSSVAAHPIEGSGNTIADHQYLKNIKIQISGHISNGVKVPISPSDFDSFESVRNFDETLESEYDSIISEAESDSEITAGIEPNVPLTQEQADALNRSDTFGDPYSEGSLVDPLSHEEVLEEASVTQQGVIESTELRKEEFVNDQAIQGAQQSDRRVYSNNQLTKQLDALILLENIRDNRLLVDVLTPNRLYTDMTMNFNLPRNMRQGTALEVNIVLEEQRFNEIDVESVPYSEDSEDLESTDKQDEKPKEVIDAGIFNTTLNILGVETVSK